MMLLIIIIVMGNILYSNIRKDLNMTHTPEDNEKNWEDNELDWENFVANLSNEYNYDDVMDFHEHFQNLASIKENINNLELFVASERILI